MPSENDFPFCSIDENRNKSTSKNVRFGFRFRPAKCAGLWLVFRERLRKKIYLNFSVTRKFCVDLLHGLPNQ